MSQRQFAIRSAFLAAALALTAGGVLTTPMPAQARPALPLAPACDKWSYPTHAFQLNQDNGILVALYLCDNQYFEGPASHTVAGKPDVREGKSSGTFGETIWSSTSTG